MKKTEINLKKVDRRFLRLTPENPYNIIFNNFEKVQDVSYDMHYDLEIGIVLKGEMTRYYEGFKMNLTPGKIWICGMWEPHGFSIKKAPCSCVVLAVSLESTLNARFDEAPGFSVIAPFTAPANKRPQVKKSSETEVLKIGSNLLKLQGMQGPLNQLKLRLEFLKLLMLVTTNWKPESKDTLKLPGTLSALNKTLSMIFKSKEHLNETKVAESLGISRNTFMDMFKINMGISFAEFALKYRLSSAASMLRNTNEPVKAIASEWGFTDSSHMIKNFMRYYGVSPDEYRRKK